VGGAPQFIGDEAVVNKSIITQGCIVEGTVKNSVLFTGVKVEKGATVVDSVIMTDSVIRSGATVTRAIVGEDVEVLEDAVVGDKESAEIVLVAKKKVK